MFAELAKEIHQNNVQKGFWDEDWNEGACFALMHSEISEALEAVRIDRHQSSEHLPEFSAVEEELADTIIRILDYAGAFGLDLDGAIKAKVEYNKKRPYKHGKKF